MKKALYLFLSAICAVCYSYASNVGHFCKDVSAQNVSVVSLTDHFPDWFDLPEATSFVLVHNSTDRLGIQHLNYQQFLGENAVEGCRVIAHARDGLVMYVNGVLLEDNIAPATPERIMPKKQIQQLGNSSTIGNCILTPVFYGDSVVYKYAYKSSSAEDGYDIYYDAESGAVLKKICNRHGLTSVQGTASTFYEGIKDITCGFDDNLYHLIDPDRKIYTYNASKAPFSLLGYRVPPSVVRSVADALATSLPAEILNDERLYECALRNAVMQRYFIPKAEQTISVPTSSSPSFTGTKVTQIVINAINNNTWQGENDTVPDLFISVHDQNGIVRYHNKADRIENATLPVTFTFDVPMWADGYQLKVWDYNEDGDKLIAALLLDQEAGTFSYSRSVNASVTQESGAPSPILDAHWGMEQTYDFYSDVFERNSFDNIGSPIYQFVNVSDTIIHNGNNAYASYASGEYAYMVYGMGSGQSRNPFVDLTVTAHEYSHLITDFSSSGGLKYENESGALNEGFSDLFAMCVENYVYGSPSWLIGHNGLMKDGKSNIRSLSDPYQNKDGDDPGPKAYLGQYWIPTTSEPDSETNDNGGVHKNSSVLNYWFYVLCTGGTITNEYYCTFTVRGIGIEKAQLLVYMLNQNYLTEYATFRDAYFGSLIIADLIYGYGSEEYQSVQNAWGVVGIGNGYQGYTYPLEEGKYLVMARRNADSTYYKMEANVGTASTKCLQATNTLSNVIASLTSTEQPESFVWEVEKVGSSYAIKCGDNYLTWTSGNSADLSAAQSLFTITPQSDGTYRVSVPDSSATRYLSLNKTEGNNYFAFYSATDQVPNLRFVRYSLQDTIVPDCKTIPFSESFSTSQGDFTIENVSLDDLNYVWTFASGYGMKASAYVSNVYHPTESWLISPCLELPEDATINLTFDHVHRYTTTPTTDLTLLVSEDYVSGAPSAATWTPVAIPAYSSGSNWTFVNAGNINLSAYAGKSITLAFCYKSSSSAAATWEIKNVSVTSSENSTALDAALDTHNATKCIINGHLFILRDGHRFTATGTMVE